MVGWTSTSSSFNRSHLFKLPAIRFYPFTFTARVTYFVQILWRWKALQGTVFSEMVLHKYSTNSIIILYKYIKKLSSCLSLMCSKITADGQYTIGCRCCAIKERLTDVASPTINLKMKCLRACCRLLFLHVVISLN